jgi:subtilisin family serine protease
MANEFFETGHFKTAEPDFLVNYQIESANDEHYGQQWGFANTGQHGGTAGIDIKAEDAWTQTTGDAAIIVAVLDHGVELDHPDLPNLASDSFDTINGSSPSVVRGDHGTACAGIVAAGRNNGPGGKLGVAGVAPGVRIMSVSHDLMLAPNASQLLADGINWAWQNGADVISNSWGHDALASALIDDAIEDALQQGREARVRSSSSRLEMRMTAPSAIRRGPMRAS